MPAMAYANHSFSDVDDGRFFTEPVEWASENGITTGKSPTIFDPFGNVTRGESVTFLKRYHDNIIDPMQILGDLSCGDDQVAIDDGGWRCADPVLQRSLAGGFSRTIPTGPSDGRFSSIVVGANGNPLVSHWNAISLNLEVFACASHDCSAGGTTHTLVSGGRDTSMTFGTNGYPLISHVSNANNLELFACNATDCSTGGTNYTLTNSGFRSSTSIVIGANGNPLISHRHGADLALFSCDAADCSTGGTSRTLAANGSGTSITLASNGAPRIANHVNNDLYVYDCIFVDCSAGVNRPLLVTGYVGGTSSITLGTNGYPLISHYNIDNGDLELFACSASNCPGGTNHTLATDGSVGSGSAIILGADGNPLIAYRNSTNGDLDLFVCSAPDCSTGGIRRPLATEGDVGIEPAIALGTDGRPVISHYDDIPEDLAVATAYYEITGITFE